jgi:DnaK suppressor protein
MGKNKKISADKKPTAKHNNEKLTAGDIEHFRKLLLDKRKEILGSVNEMEDEALKKSRLDAAGNLSSMPIHMADLGSDNFEQEFALGLVDGERKMLREIDDALGRIEEGTFGICQGLNKPIPKARLEAQPWARYGVEYAEMLEKGQVPEEKE